MSPSEINSNSNFVETKQDDLKMMQDSSLNPDIIHDPKKLKDRIMDLVKGDTEFSKMKQGDKALVVGTASGLFTAVLPLLAVGATLAIPGAIVGLTLFFAAKVAVKAVLSGYKGLKWSAEKTVEGAKHIGGKIKDGHEYSADSLKRGASFVSEGAANKLHKAAGKEDYLDKIKRFTPKQIGKSDEIRKDLKEIFADKGNNSELIKDILSGISSGIDSKIKEKAESGQIDQTFERLLEQEKFISGLSKESLHSLLTQRSLPKDTYFIDSIFSEHHDEIKEVIRECKEEHTRFNTLERLNKSAKRHKASSMNSLENSLSGSSSTSSISTVSSKAELLNPSEHKKVNAISSLKSKLPSWLGGEKAPEEAKKGTDVNYRPLSESGEISTAVIGKPGAARRNSTGNLTKVSTPKVPTSASLTNLNKVVSSSLQSSFSQDVLNDPTVKQNLNASSSRTLTRSDSVSILASNISYSSAISTLSDIDKSTAPRSNSFIYHSNSDSGFNSPSSSPQHGMPTKENGKLKTQDELRNTGSLDKLVRPSSTVTVDTDVEQQASKINGK